MDDSNRPATKQEVIDASDALRKELRKEFVDANNALGDGLVEVIRDTGTKLLNVLHVCEIKPGASPRERRRNAGI